MQIRAGFSENYDIVGKHLAQDESFVKQFFRQESACEQLFPQNSVIRFNSEYMDVLGNWYFLKPGAVPTSIILISICIFMIPLGILGLINLNLDKLNIIWVYAALFLFIGMFAFLFFKIRRDFFHYTYYPMRFHRAERKVYVTQPNKKVMVYNWDDLKITLHSSARNHFFIHLSITDPYQKSSIPLPFLTYPLTAVKMAYSGIGSSFVDICKMNCHKTPLTVSKSITIFMAVKRKCLRSFIHVL